LGGAAIPRPLSQVAAPSALTPEYHEAVRLRPSQPWSRQQFLDAVLPKGMLFAVGEDWAYSNIGYMLLLHVLESVTRQPFARIVQSLLIEPLALERTFVVERREDWGRCVAGFGLEVDVEGRVVDIRAAYHPGWCAPGLVASTAEEITYVFDSFLAGHLLQADTLAEMLALTVITDDPGETLSGGMGVFSDPTSPYGRNYGHGGGGPGYELDVTALPETRLGQVTVAVFANRSCGPQAPLRAAHCVKSHCSHKCWTVESTARQWMLVCHDKRRDVSDGARRERRQAAQGRRRNP
jgi:D-alanyl-D-alanine carboxypeptidase